jgi:Protein kinase domain
VRHRKTGTLYVSDLIEPPKCKDPGYGKLQVGIYVAAIQDRMDRTKQRLQLSQPKSPYDGGDDPAGGDNDKGDRGSGSGYKGDHGNPGGGVRKNDQFQGGAGRKDSVVDELVAIEVCLPQSYKRPDQPDHKQQKTIQAASKCDMLHLYLQYGIYDSPIPASFIRSAPPLSPRAIHTYTDYECMSIVLTSEIGRGATGIVRRGTLEPQNGDGSVPLDVVVKLAFNSHQQDMLKTEYETYSRLRSKGVFRGLTTTLGFFDDTEEGPCALVMLYAGDSLVDKPERVLSDSEWYVSRTWACFEMPNAKLPLCVNNSRLALSTLASIHRAGILHGDIRRENILVSSSGVTIIDFSHSERCDSQEAMDKERARFRFFLGFE